MPYVAFIMDHIDHYLGRVVGNGQCVALVEKFAHTPSTHSWKPGPLVRGNFWLPRGTAIATFRHGRYPNLAHGYSHAAIYLRQDAFGIWVLDQWRGQPVHERHIPFTHSTRHVSNNSNAFSVIL
jgi:hypothetical protein